MRLKLKNLVWILFLLAVIALYARTVTTGEMLVREHYEQLSELHAEIYLSSLAALSTVRQLAPFQVGLIFCVLTPFILLLEQNYKKFFLTLLASPPIFNIIAIASSLRGAYNQMIKLNIQGDIIGLARQTLAPHDVITSFVKVIFFALTLGLLGRILSKYFLKNKGRAEKIIFVLISAPIGVVAVLLVDISITFLSYKLSF